MTVSSADIHSTALERDFLECEDRIYLSGLQALARIPVIQHRRDIVNGLNTGGYVTGYRGSPLEALDRQLERTGQHLREDNITFQPAINEDMAATALWGTQQVNLYPGAQVDGVFGIWYGKAPGVDRSGDALRHANQHGTAPYGGVIAIAGDDHGCVSSILSTQSDQAFAAFGMPVIYPSDLREFVEFGLLGIEMSRYSGCWVGYKTTSKTVEGTGTVDIGREQRIIEHPEAGEFTMPEAGVHIRREDSPAAADWRLLQYKLFAAQAFARKNNIDRITIDTPGARLGILTAGKSHNDVMESLNTLGVDDEAMRQIGLRIYKVGMIWPLEPQGIREFAEGLEQIVVVEEKREFLESQLRDILYNNKHRPRIVGKYDENGAQLFNRHLEHSMAHVISRLGARLLSYYDSDRLRAIMDHYEKADATIRDYTPPGTRVPYNCAGCPHNTSTRLPEGSEAIAGIGCHYMVTWMQRNSEIVTHMGGEGIPWMGVAPFTSTQHIFTNLGDGTYYHSGILAIRQAIAAGINITYKILYNDAVAMTGGQPVDGELPVERVAQQVMAEGASKCWLVSERPDIYKGRANLPDSVPVHDRDDLTAIMHEARNTQGTSIIIYDHTCAAEKRRRRKRGTEETPDKRVMINEDVCEGCGDCSVQSNCLAVEPVETEFGRKRRINQSSCNMDYSCLKGHCPSFITIEGGELAQPDWQSPSIETILRDVPDITPPATDHPYNILIAGIGGNGILTISAILGVAAHMDGLVSHNLDQKGLSQKAGEVISQVRIATAHNAPRNNTIAPGACDLLLACDRVSAVGAVAYATLDAARTAAVINSDYTPVPDFVLHNDMDFRQDAIDEILATHTDHKQHHRIDADTLAQELLGQDIAANIFMLGYAWQQGLLPISLESLNSGIELNGAAVEMNRKAFAYGRLAAHNRAKLDEYRQSGDGQGSTPLSQTLDEVIARREEHLRAYQNDAYAARYTRMLAHIRDKESAVTGDDDLRITRQIAHNYHRLLAYKDEYEVARLYTQTGFIDSVRKRFTAKHKIRVHLAIPGLSRKDPATGRRRKYGLSGWILPVFAVLAKFKGLRGTPFDPFGYQAIRRQERQLIRDYEDDMALILNNLGSENYDHCVRLAAYPEHIKGFGPIKQDTIAHAMTMRDQIRKTLHNIVGQAQNS